MSLSSEKREILQITSVVMQTGIVLLLDEADNITLPIWQIQQIFYHNRAELRKILFFYHRHLKWPSIFSGQVGMIAIFLVFNI